MGSRVQNTSKNFIASALAQIISILLSLVSRTVFIITLGEGYLGINGLFSNILSVLSLAELGIGTAMIYSMYKPLAENDNQKVSALVNYYRKLYTNIAIIIGILGLSLTPFLEFFINLDTPIDNLKLYYLLFLGQTVSSYLIVYRTSVLTADQKGFLTAKNAIIGNLSTMLLQTIILLITKNYALYLIIQVVCGLIVNYLNSRIAVKRYPFILNKSELNKDDKKQIWVNIKSMFAYKLGDAILNNTDNLLISKMVSTTLLGVYSNYVLLITRVANMINLVFTSMQASLGNLNAKATEETLYRMFKNISFIEYWIYSVSSIAFCLLFNDFIEIWIGENYVLSPIIVYTCVINFYLKGVLYPIWCYRNTTGLFKDTKYMMTIASALNLLLSIILGIKFGLFGILIATAIARLLTNIWYEPYLLFKKYFKQKVFKYYLTEIIRALAIVIFVILSEVIFYYYYVPNKILNFIIKFLYCAIVPNILLWFILRKTKEFDYVYAKVKIAMVGMKTKIIKK